MNIFEECHERSGKSSIAGMRDVWYDRDVCTI